MSRERDINIVDYYGRINYLINEGVCSREIDKCKNVPKQDKKNLNIPYCHLYMNRTTKQPCRQGALYGCREYNQPRKTNIYLLKACEHKNNIEEAKKRKQGRLFREPSSRSIQSLGSSRSIRSSRSNSRSLKSRERSRTSIKKKSNITREDKSLLEKNKKAFLKYGIDPNMKYIEAPRLGGVTRKYKKYKKYKKDKKHKKNKSRKTNKCK